MSESPWTQHCRWHPVEDAAAMRSVAAARILASADLALAERGRFLLVLAGGNTPRGVYELLRASQADWSRWHIYYGDECCTPTDDAARNSRMAGLAWLDHVPIPAEQIHAMPAELGPKEAAERYTALLEPVGEFDLVLLGLGEDGHTASLFPGHDVGRSVDAPAALPVTGAPKPPPDRVTLSARRLSRALEVIFLVGGDDKRDAVARWRAGEPIPARAITPGAGVDVIVEAALLRPART
jgi:6-phosphogluconolactonase